QRPPPAELRPRRLRRGPVQAVPEGAAADRPEGPPGGPPRHAPHVRGRRPAALRLRPAGVPVRRAACGPALGGVRPPRRPRGALDGGGDRAAAAGGGGRLALLPVPLVRQRRPALGRPLPPGRGPPAAAQVGVPPLRGRHLAQDQPRRPGERALGAGRAGAHEGALPGGHQGHRAPQRGRELHPRQRGHGRHRGRGAGRPGGHQQARGALQDHRALLPGPPPAGAVRPHPQHPARLGHRRERTAQLQLQPGGLPQRDDGPRGGGGRHARPRAPGGQPDRDRGDAPA
ncbi:unnamed protein product, partial [Heterosigma akashiwo]